MKQISLDGFSMLAIFCMMFSLCTTRPNTGYFFKVRSQVAITEDRRDSAKLKAQTALVQYENSFQAAYLEALKAARAGRIMIIDTDRPEKFNNDTIYYR